VNAVFHLFYEPVSVVPVKFLGWFGVNRGVGIYTCNHWPKRGLEIDSHLGELRAYVLRIPWSVEPRNLLTFLHVPLTA
jgi:hypothetical protein